jgi:hypothetical protein
MHGDIFTVEDWLEMVDSRALIDYDGCGRPLGGGRKYLLLNPSAFFMAPWPPKESQEVGVLTRSKNRAWLRANYRYAIWYNR